MWICLLFPVKQNENPSYLRQGLADGSENGVGMPPSVAEETSTADQWFKKCRRRALRSPSERPGQSVCEITLVVRLPVKGKMAHQTFSLFHKILFFPLEKVYTSVSQI